MQAVWQHDVEHSQPRKNSDGQQCSKQPGLNNLLSLSTRMEGLPVMLQSDHGHRKTNPGRHARV